MDQIEVIKKGPKAYVNVINKIITVINGLSLTSKDIPVTVTKNGWILGATPKKDDKTHPEEPTTNPSTGGSSGGGGGTGVAPSDGSIPGWYLMNFVLPTPTGYTISQRWVWSAEALTQSANPPPTQ